MSRATGECRFEDGTVYYFEYCGTTDTTLPQLYETKEELYANWRRDYTDEEMIELGDRRYAATPTEEVELYSHYGGGFSYKGRASKEQMVITWDEQSQASLDEAKLHRC